MKGFEEVIKKFPRCAEGYALYAQALTDQQQFGKADEMYDKCINLEPDNATTYVHKGYVFWGFVCFSKKAKLLA